MTAPSHLRAEQQPPAARTAGASPLEPAAPMWLRVWQTLRLWHRRSWQRQALATLGERELHDIGLDRAAVYRECRKWFWQA